MKKLLLIILAIVFLILMWLSQKPRLDAYNDCYMAKYKDWSTDCVLMEGTK